MYCLNSWFSEDNHFLYVTLWKHSMVKGFQIIYSSFLVHPLSKTYTRSVVHLFCPHLHNFWKVLLQMSLLVPRCNIIRWFSTSEWGNATSQCDRLVNDREQRWGHEEKSLIVTQTQTDGKQTVAYDASKTVKALSRSNLQQIRQT